MKDNSWNPGHGIAKGYPWDRNESAHALANRVHVNQGEDLKIYIDWKNEDFPGQELTNLKQEDRTEFEDFLLFRLFDAYKALEMAEGQIEDMFKEAPFTPESFGFVLAHKNATISEPPVRIYVSRYNDRISLFRKPGTPFDKEWNSAAWTLMRKNDDSSFTETDVLLPCHRIAFAALYSLRVQVEEPFEKHMASEKSVQAGIE